MKSRHNYKDRFNRMPFGAKKGLQYNQSKLLKNLSDLLSNKLNDLRK